MLLDRVTDFQETLVRQGATHETTIVLRRISAGCADVAVGGHCNLRGQSLPAIRAGQRQERQPP